MNTTITQKGEDILLNKDGDTVPYMHPYFSKAILTSENQKINYTPFETGEMTVLNNRTKNQLNFDVNDKGELEVIGYDAKRYFINRLIGFDIQTEFEFKTFWKNTHGISDTNPLYNLDAPLNTSCSANKAGVTISNESGEFKVDCDNSTLETISTIVLSFVNPNTFAASKHTIEVTLTEISGSQGWIDPTLDVVSYDIIDGDETIYVSETHHITEVGTFSFDFIFPANNIIELRFTGGIFKISELKITKFAGEILLYPEYEDGVLVYDDDAEIEQGIEYMEIENNFIID